MSIEWNPHYDKDGNCVNCGTGQLNFDGKDTGCACSRVADAEYETEQRIIKLLESLKGTCDNDCDECRPYAEKNDHYLSEVIALIKGENK